MQELHEFIRKVKETEAKLRKELRSLEDTQKLREKFNISKSFNAHMVPSEAARIMVIRGLA